MRAPQYTSPTARAVLRKLLDRLEVGPATMLELIGASGKSAGRARDYIMHLRAIDQIICTVEAVNSFAGSTPSVWALNPDFVSDAENVMDDSFDYCPRVVVIRQQWAPHHVRMPLDCFLFGVPSAMAAA